MESLSEIYQRIKNDNKTYSHDFDYKYKDVDIFNFVDGLIHNISEESIRLSLLSEYVGDINKQTTRYSRSKVLLNYMFKFCSNQEEKEEANAKLLTVFRGTNLEKDYYDILTNFREIVIKHPQCYERFSSGIKPHIKTKKALNKKDFILEFLTKEFPELKCFDQFNGYIHESVIEKQKIEFDDIVKFSNNGKSKTVAQKLEKKKRATPDKVFEKLLETENGKNIKLVYGKVQSGKSSGINSLGLFYVLNGISVVNLVCNKKSHILQLENHLNSMIGNLNQKLQAHGYEKIDIPIINCGDLTSKIKQDKFNEAVTGKNPGFIMCLANGTQVNRFNSMIGTLNAKNFIVIADEADKNLHPLQPGEKEEGEPVDVKYYNAIEELKEIAPYIYGFTATPLDLLKLNNLNNDDIIILEPRDSRYNDIETRYVGIGNIEYVIDQISDDACPPSKTQIMPATDPNFEKFYTWFLSKKLRYNYKGFPNICLHVATKLNDPMINTMIWMKNHQVLSNIVTMTYIGEGVKLYSKQLEKNESLVLANGIKAKRNGEKMFSFDKAQIQDVLQYIKDNGGSTKFPHIVIFAGHLANRSVNFVSRDFGWHCLYQYLIPSSTTNVAELIQSMRICGKFNIDDLHPIAFVSKKTYNALIKGYFQIEEIMGRVVRKEFDKKETVEEQQERLKNLRLKPLSCAKILNEMKLNENKDPKMKLTRHKQVKMGYTSDNDRGVPVEVLNRIMKERVIEIKELKEPESEIEEKEQVQDDGLDENERMRLVSKMFPKWSKTNLKISNFMQNLDPKHKYSSSELQELCKTHGVRLADIYGKYKNVYGHIICKNNDKYFLYPSLVSHFIQYF